MCVCILQECQYDERDVESDVADGAHQKAPKEMPSEVLKNKGKVCKN